MSQTTTKPSGAVDPDAARNGTVADATAHPLVQPLRALGAGSLAVAGGKGANLGILLQADVPVPDGFCVTTSAYGAVAATTELLQVIVRLAGVPPDDIGQLAALAGEARGILLAAPIPAMIADAIGAAYRELDGARVAVRSSATAEDLPSASFAGQQDTYLNIVGEDALLDAVRRCWASLWTDRAVTYRAANGIDHASVRLAVVVQRMVPASAAGVLFTANPLTGHRGQMVVDASPGLGEAVVSGAVNPDHWVLNGTTGAAIETKLGDKRLAIRAAEGGGTERVTLADGSAEACLTADQLRDLASLGRRVQALFGAPQDVEFAFDGDGRCWLVQARPITTLYPLPADAPAPDQGQRVYFSINVAQGVFRPLTPMGIQGLRLVASSMATAFGAPPDDRLAGPASVKEAGHRLFADVTPALKHPVGRKLLFFATRFMEARTRVLVEQLARDPRLSTEGTSARPLLARIGKAVVRHGVPVRVAHALARPTEARLRAERTAREVLALGEVPAGVDAATRLALIEEMLMAGLPRLMLRVMPVALVGLFSRTLAGRLLGDLATAEELERVVRALPHNPTTEMDLALWSLADELRADPASAQALTDQPAAVLAAAYRDEQLPAVLQASLQDFLAAWGDRGVAEIDLGLPRWAEDPTHILGVLANYLRLEDLSRAPDAQFAQAAAQAEDTIETLSQRAGTLRSGLVRGLLRRSRELSGLREWPKYYFVALSARARASLKVVGAELAARGRLEAADDIFFVTVPEARAGLGGTDLRSLVAERREGYDREIGRRHVPRLLLSDGTEPTPPVEPGDEVAGALRGTPASSGVARGRARVVLDPVGAHLEPGEILVAPSTDPGWTPLFLTAAGLVMEMGGAMSHGSVVAREYGIPAVVGVDSASLRISTGQTIEVDGGRGIVRIVEETTPTA
jgi:phosphohistidine swiveling domain-containing protein